MREAEYARLWQWRQGKRLGPWEVVFFPTNRCNQRCVHCWQRRAEGEAAGIPGDELSDARLIEMVDEAHALGARYCYIVGGGEPMIRARVVMEMCEKIRAYGMYGTLHTNGALFSRNHLERLVQAGWNEVVVSLDGPDAETNDALRGPGAFDSVMKNLKRLAEIRRQHQTALPKVTLNMVITNTNFDKLDRMVQLAHDLECEGGLVYSAILPLNDDCARLELNDSQREQLPEHVRRAIDLADRLKVPHLFDSLLPGNEGSSDATTTPSPRRYHRFSDSLCFEACRSLTITADGLTGPCCMSWDQEAPRVQKERLDEIWYGDYFKRLRQRLRRHRDLPAYCRDCPDHLKTSTRHFRARLKADELPKSRLGRMLGHIRQFRGQRTREALKRHLGRFFGRGSGGGTDQ